MFVVMLCIENVVKILSFTDFEMTDAQYEHALAVERVATGLAALRIELCPAYMSEYCFWRIYFVLMHPKFSKHDALLLSTPQVSLFLFLHCLFIANLTELMLQWKVLRADNEL